MILYQVYSVENYENGELDGNSTNYYENRQIKVEGNYKDGKKDGKWIWYFENGKKDVEENY